MKTAFEAWDVSAVAGEDLKEMLLASKRSVWSRSRPPYSDDLAKKGEAALPSEESRDATRLRR